MEAYKSNSHKSKEKVKTAEKPVVQKVVNGNVQVKKKSGARKLADIFVAEDATKVKGYILRDVIVPAAKKLITDIVKDGIDMIFYGGTTTKRTYSDGFRAGYVNYNKISDGRSKPAAPANSPAVSVYDHNNIALETRGEADIVLSTMGDVLDQYGEVSVATLYELVGLPHKYTDNNYGWTSLGGAKISRTMDGRYLLDLPRVTPLKD